MKGFINKLFNQGVLYAKSEEERRIITLQNKLSVYFGLSILPGTFLLAYLNIPILVLALVFSLGVFVFCLWLNRKGHFTYSRWTFILYINTSILFFAPTYGYEFQIVYVYFPISCLPILLFPIQQKSSIFTGFSISLIFFLILKMELIETNSLIQVSEPMLAIFNAVVTLNTLFVFICIIGYIFFDHYQRVIRLNKALLQADELLTQQKHIQEELNQAKEKAEAGSKSKSQFLSTMSHEIRTPLNAMIGFSSLLGETTLDHEQTDYIKTIKKSGDNLLSIINDILDHAKIESGKLELEYQDILLKEPILDTFDLLRSKAQEKSLSLNYVIDDNIPQVIKSDITRIRQVLVNLVNNAIKFTKAGGISVRVSGNMNAEKVHKIQFCIEDSGVGISEEGIKRLFQSFSQVDASTTRKYGGTGLGLAICRQLVELLGGKIWVESTVGVGSKFFFTISCKEGMLDLKNVDRIKSLSQLDIESREARHTKSLKILLAEDNHINQKVATKVIAKIGYKIDIANNGLEVLEAMKRVRYDLILMDVQMPEMDGIEACKEICKLYPQKEDRPKIFALTANALQEDRNICLAAGMDDFIKKPFKVETLDKVIYSWFYTTYSH